jgi:hypothetical protein
VMVIVIVEMVMSIAVIVMVIVYSLKILPNFFKNKIIKKIF